MELAFLCVVVFTSASASQVSFTAAPTELKTNLTDSSSLRCSVGPSSDNATVDVHRVVSIIVMHGVQDVASVTATDAAMSYVQNLDVKGTISAVSGEGYIQLSWTDASQMELGEYTCDVTATGPHGHHVLMTSSLEMTTVPPTINDVIHVFKQANEQQNVQHRQEIEKLQQIITKIQRCTSPHVGFTATLSNTDYISLASGIQAKFDNVLMNVGGAYSASTGDFTCVTAGMYSFQLHVLGYSDKNACLQLQLNGRPLTSAMAEADNWNTASSSAVVDMKQGDVMRVMTCYSSGFYQPSPSSHWGYQQNIFSGHLIQAADCSV